MFLKPQEVIEFLSSRLFVMPGFKIADFGCGGGYFTTLFAEKVGPEGKVFAIDIQEDAVQETKELAEVLGFKNIEYHRADLKKTAFEDGFFDMVFISQVLFQNKKFEEIIKEAKRVLRDKGFLVILEPKTKLNFLYGDIVDKNALFSAIKNENLTLAVDKEFEENYYIVVLEK